MLIFLDYLLIFLLEVIPKLVCHAEHFTLFSVNSAKHLTENRINAAKNEILQSRSLPWAQPKGSFTMTTQRVLGQPLVNF